MPQLPKIAIATLHQKERWLSPALSQIFDPNWQVVPWDTDALGTFSGETERVGGPTHALESKLIAALEHSDATWVAASEGSYGPHPSFPWLTLAEEHLWIRERATGFTWKQKLRDLAPFARSWNLDRLPGIPSDVQLPLDEIAGQDPQQSYLLRLGEKRVLTTRKNLSNAEEIRQAIEAFWPLWVACPQEFLILQTELRAHLCPGRQALLARLAELMAADFRRICPGCGQGGWSLSGKEPGLPCEGCGSPTRVAGYTVHSCPRCGHSERIALAGFADMGLCDFCNP
jgi:hypothetical protein